MKIFRVPGCGFLIFALLITDVFFDALASAPLILQPPFDHTTVDGKTVKLTCRALGAPKPAIKWVRDGLELTGGRYKIMDVGDLQIEDVAFSDAGEYTCYASNEDGDANAIGYLTVKQHTEITEVPEDCEVAAGDTATFRCNAVTDSTLPLRINWLRKGELINFESEPRFTVSNDNSLMITKTTELDSGTYTCIAITDFDVARAQATLTVRSAGH